MADVLIIDDDAALRRVLRRMLEAEGHDVVEAEDGLRGLSLVSTKPFAVAFVDLFMPGLDGLELIPKLRLQAPGTKVVAMSGGYMGGRGIDLLRAAEKAGAEAKLGKPFGAADVTTILAELLG